MAGVEGVGSARVEGELLQGRDEHQYRLPSTRLPRGVQAHMGCAGEDASLLGAPAVCLCGVDWPIDAGEDEGA